MKTRKEIEEEIKKHMNDLGIEVISSVREIPYNENGILTFFGLKYNGDKDHQKRYYTFKTINEEAEKAFIDYISKSIMEGDMERAVVTIDILQQKSDRYRIRRDAALEGVPLEKKMKYWDYCQKQNNGAENKEDLSTYISVKQRKAMERDDEER